MKQEIYIDGEEFDTLEGFFQCFNARALGGLPWGQNLAAFNDVLRGGFGTPRDGFVLVWKNHALSKTRLGYQETVRQLEKELERCHTESIPLAKARLDAACQGVGPTAYDWLTDVIRVHCNGGDEEEDGIELRLC